MIGDRARGLLLYACAAAVLAGGGVWWFRAAPHDRVDPQLARWRQNAERLLPDVGGEAASGTLTLAAGADHQVLADLDNGVNFDVSVVCVGAADSQVRISLSDDDSGRGLDCSGDRGMFSFPVALPGQLRMDVSVGDVGPVVFRYAVHRTG